MNRTLVLTLALTLAVAACSSGPEPAPPPAPDSPVSTILPPGQQIPTQPSPSPVQPTKGLENVHAVQWGDALVGADDRTVTLTYYTGVPDCYGLDRVEIAYDPDRITMTMFEGTVPGAQACIEIAVFASTTVTLDEPVDGRPIVDGAKGSATPG